MDSPLSETDQPVEQEQTGTNTSGQQVAVQAENLDTAVSGTETAAIGYGSRALNSVGQDEVVSRVADATGTQVNPDQSPDYPNNQTVEHDLDPGASGDLTIGPTSVLRSQSVVVSGNSVDGQNWTANVDWEDGSGNVFASQSGADIGLSGVSNTATRLFRKGPQVSVTYSSDATSGTQNRINAYVGVHR